MQAIIAGTEQRMNRNLFKIAVELGKISHTVAVANGVDDETLQELHAMCVDEVRHINGMISYESAVRFQNDLEDWFVNNIGGYSENYTRES